VTYLDGVYPFVIVEKIGLVVITLERYFKIVHAIAHRKYYRDWMTKVGVILPWISGFCTFAIPSAVSTKALPALWILANRRRSKS